MVDTRHRPEFWREVSRPLFELLPTSNEKEKLEGFVHSYNLGELTLASVRFNQQSYMRNRQTIVRSGLEHYLLQIVTDGAMTADCDGVSILARPGDIWLFDLARPYRCNAEAGSRITLVLPREPIDRANGGRSAHGLVLPAAHPLTGLLRRYLIDLHETAGGLASDDLRAMEVATADFVISVINRRLGGGSRHSSSTDRVRQRMLEFIDAHIDDPQLGPDMMVRHFQMSRAHLYRFFAERGGVAAFIRNRRLDAAYRMLRMPSSGRRTITDIAFKLGFANSGHFARAFAGRFGVTPSRLPGAWPSREETEAAPLQSHLETQVQNWRERA
jgi:AraC-like DNA-binding protein